MLSLSQKIIEWTISTSPPPSPPPDAHITDPDPALAAGPAGSLAAGGEAGGGRALSQLQGRGRGAGRLLVVLTDGHWAGSGSLLKQPIKMHYIITRYKLFRKTTISCHLC